MALTSDPRLPGAITLDAHGNPMSAPPAAVDLYDRVVDRLVRFDPEVVDLAGELATEHPDVPMAQVALAYLCLMSTDVGDLEVARGAAQAAAELPLTHRERAHVEAIGAWARGDWHRAQTLLDDLLVEWPTDVLALLLGHALDFYLGDRVNLRDRVGRSLAALEGHDHHGFALGMQAFGLEECGTYDAALHAGLAALDAHPDDVWAVHAVAHVHEMRGDVDQGLRTMAEHRDGWTGDNLFSVHLWWHESLYLLQAGRIDDVLAIYDARIHHASSGPAALELLDASALLWRLRLRGIDTGDRFDALAAAWGARPGSGEPWYVFNDVHEVMALAGAGRLVDAHRRLDVMADSIAEGAGPTNRAVTAEVGLPVARALVASAEGRHADVVADLWPVRPVLHHFGGSHAQRDLVDQTLVDSAIASGDLARAGSLLRERFALRPSSTFGWSRQARLAAANGDRPGEAAARRAEAVATARFAAVDAVTVADVEVR
jgi:tetratricopeptide (TPR) repeat protein